MNQLLGLISYRQKRVVRNFIFPAVSLLALLAGIMVCREFTVLGSGGFLIAFVVPPYAFLLGLLLLLAAAILVGREEDEGSDVFLLAAPLSSPVIFLVKILSLWPLVAAVFLGLFIPVMIELSIAWWRAGYDLSLILAETGIFLLYLLPSLLFTTVLGGIFGIMKRGLLLYLLILFTWFFSFFGVETLSRSGWPASPRSSLWPLLSWPARDMGIGLDRPLDLWSFLPGLPVWAWQRSFYLAVTIAVIFCAALLFRRKRWGHKKSSFFLPLATIFSLVTVLIMGTGFHLTREPIIASARAEIEHYINFTREHPEHFQIAFENQFVRINSYDLHLDISEPPLLTVRALLAVENFGMEKVSPLHLTLRHHFRVSEARAGGSLLAVKQVGDRVIFPGTVLAPGESIEIMLEYAGIVEEWHLCSVGLPVGTYLKHFVKDYGLYLPPAYGWYPILSALPLTVLNKSSACPQLNPYWMVVDELAEMPLSLSLEDPWAYRSYIRHIVSILPVVQEDEEEAIVLDEWELSERASLFEKRLGKEGIEGERKKDMLEEKLKTQVREEKMRLEQMETIAGLLPWREETFFRVTIEPLPHYMLVSNLAEKRYIEDAGAGTRSSVLFEGYAPYLFLMGWPLERIVMDGGVAYAPAKIDMEAAAGLIEAIQFMRDWFGAPREEVRLVSFPLRGPRERITAISGGKFYVDDFLILPDGWCGESIIARIAANLLCGVRMPNHVETRLIEAFIEARRRCHMVKHPEDPEIIPPSYIPWINLDKAGLPQAAAIVDWLEENEAAAENPVHALLLLSRTRPLREEDLDVFDH